MKTVRDKKTGLEYVYVQHMSTKVTAVLWLLCLCGTILGLYIADPIMFFSGFLSLGFIPMLSQWHLVEISARKNIKEMLTEEFLEEMNAKIDRNIRRKS